MNFSDLEIQTLRTAPNEFRKIGSALLFRAGFIQRDLSLTKFGKLATDRVTDRFVTKEGWNISFLSPYFQTILQDKTNSFVALPHPNGQDDVLYCQNCHNGQRVESYPHPSLDGTIESPAEMKKVITPECNTIVSLAEFLSIPTSKTAKALMFTSLQDGRFIFVVVRGDHTLSEAKLTALVGPTRMATQEEIIKAGAVPGYASPIGIKDALVLVDHFIPKCPNLVSGANESGYHMINTNFGRDYQADQVADLTLAQEGDPCHECHQHLMSSKAFIIAENDSLDARALLFAAAETWHDEKGLVLPKMFAPFDVYLMNIPSNTIDTANMAKELFDSLVLSGISTLLDDRPERAGIKFNDADLLGFPIRITVGERGMQSEQVEVKLRKGDSTLMVGLKDLPAHIHTMLENFL